LNAIINVSGLDQSTLYRVLAVESLVTKIAL